MTVFSSDTFGIGTSGQNLTARNGEVGAVWSKHPSKTGDFLLSSSGRTYCSNTVGRMYFTSGVPVSEEYDVQCIIRFLSSAGDAPGVVGRCSTTVEDCYLARTTGTAWDLFKIVGGAATSLGTFAQTLTTGVDYTLLLQIRNATKRLFVDGVQRVSSTDNAITAAGRAGLRENTTTTATNTTGTHLDNFVATDLSTIYSGAAALQGVGSLSANGTRTTFGASSLIGVGSLGATALVTMIGAATFQGVGGLSADGIRTTSGAADFIGVGSLNASGIATLQGAASLSGVGSLSAAATAVLFGSSSLQGVGLLTADGLVVAPGSLSASLIGVGVLTADGRVTMVGSAALSGVGTLTANGTVSSGNQTYPGAANLQGIGALSATITLTAYGAALLSGVGRLTANGTVQSGGGTVPILLVHGGGENALRPGGFEQGVRRSGFETGRRRGGGSN